GGRSLKYSAMERLVRLAFFEFVRRDPRFVFETFVIAKPKFIWNNIIDATVTEWSRAGSIPRVLFFLTIGLIGGVAARDPVELQRLLRLTTVVTIGGLASLSIPLLTLPYANTMTEEIMAIQISGVLLITVAIAYLVRAMAGYRFVKSQWVMITRPLE